jgi:hypothetical protein
LRADVARRIASTPEKRQSFVYFVQTEHTHAVKIGVSRNVPARVAAFPTSCPERLKLLGAFPGTATDELHLHQRFDHLRICGEWFAPSLELTVALLRAARSAGARGAED